MSQLIPSMNEYAKQQELQSSGALNAGMRLELLKRYAEGIAALASGLLIAIAYLMENVSHAWAVAFYLTAFAVGGFVKAKEGLTTLIAERDLDVNLLMLVAAIGAASIGYWTEGAVLIFIFSLSGALESYTMDRSSRDISSLMDQKPETGVLLLDGAEKVVPIEALKPGDLVIVKPGEKIPSDGIVTEGLSSVNQASITGESVPADKAVGDEVYAGTLNGEGALIVRVTQASESTLFAKIIKLVQEAQSEKPASQLFMERFERVYARLIILVSLLLIFVPPLLFDVTWESALYKAMVFLVVASPCALVASIMPAMLSAISNSARKGVLFKGGAHLENLAGAKAVAFDKTGTLTQGKPVVTDLIPLSGYREDEALRIAASLESLSGHPLAKAIVAKAKESGIEAERPTDFTALTGWGIQAKMNGELWRIGKPALLDEGDRSEELNGLIERLESEGKTVSLLLHSQGAAAIFALRDEIRAEAKLAVAKLRRLGLHVAMLTGDQSRTAEAIGKELDIDSVHADLLPEDKVNRVKELRQRFGSVVMVGDGVNDAPALATANVGIAMGAAGSDAALETADLVLMNDDTGRIADAIVLGKRTKSIINQNIVFALSVIVLLLAGNFIQGIALPLGVIGHEGSTILVILNGLRLLRHKAAV
ncbi:heavy metal translocating P-type ATPase [Paenibacillaceae bacterium WGS1546]|uniref:heavy metal translocating P-type ATPase n=1 Tax=Cohnella sp. WGS1546 TaxID=3366810 RepID=UPI00372D66E6